MKKVSTGNLFAGMRSSSVIAGLFIALIVSIVLLFANFAYLDTQSNHDKQYISHAGELRVPLQRTAKNATEATTGKDKAFKLLKDARSDFEKRWNIPVDGDESISLPLSPEAVRPWIDVVQRGWDGLRKNADSILASRQTVLSLCQVASIFAETIPQLRVEYEEVVDILLESGVPTDQVAVTRYQPLPAERIPGLVNKVLTGDENSMQAADNSGCDAGLLSHVLKGMQKGNAAMSTSKMTNTETVDRLNEIAEFSEPVSGSVDEALETSSNLFQVQKAANNIFGVLQTLLDKALQLTDGFENPIGGHSISLFTGYVLDALAPASIILIGLVMVRETNRRLAEVAEKNDRNQIAILRLLDETTDLVGGDLTVTATVIENFAGATADSINHSIDQLHELVETINQTAVQVIAATQETQSVAMHLVETSKHQAQETASTSTMINEMAVSIDQVSANASESSAVAERSAAIANKDNEVICSTVTGMDSIHEQIRDTSKRIRRLGESSQEIGNIASLINDIADQTNILALNATIQASVARDMSRDSVVVADEVQRLAEHFSAATKQIEALVKTAQTNTNEAVISIEQTTSEVVRGTRLAQDAGMALEETGKVPKTLTTLIQNISGAARQQASSVGHVSSTMSVIQEIISQTPVGITAAAWSISSLTKMANEMRNPVSSPKLSEGVEQV